MAFISELREAPRQLIAPRRSASTFTPRRGVRVSGGRGGGGVSDWTRHGAQDSAEEAEGKQEEKYRINELDEGIIGWPEARDSPRLRGTTILDEQSDRATVTKAWRILPQRRGARRSALSIRTLRVQSEFETPKEVAEDIAPKRHVGGGEFDEMSRWPQTGNTRSTCL